jgi:uncharacterized protein (DUF952 family)
MPIILHIARRSLWERALTRGRYEPESLLKEGFVHCSAPSQVLRVANALYRGENDLVLLKINPQCCQAETRWEALYQANELFPHVYGPIEVSAVEHVFPFPPKENGSFVLPAEVAALLQEG